MASLRSCIAATLIGAGNGGPGRVRISWHVPDSELASVEIGQGLVSLTNFMDRTPGNDSGEAVPWIKILKKTIGLSLTESQDRNSVSVSRSAGSRTLSAYIFMAESC